MVKFEDSGCIMGKVVIFGQRWLYSSKVVVFGQSGCIKAGWMFLIKSGCNREKVIIFRQKLLYSDKLFVLGQKCLYSGKFG